MTASLTDPLERGGCRGRPPVRSARRPVSGILRKREMPEGLQVHTENVDMDDLELFAKAGPVVGEQLSLERRAAGLTCLELDNAAFLLPGTTMHAERGGKLSRRSLEAIGLVLGFDPAEFSRACAREVRRRSS